MKSSTLGIDLGTNSIGWALIEFEDNEPINLIDSGVRIFQEAVEAKTRTPKNIARRDARSARRLTSRRRMRRDYIRSILQEHHLLPSDREELDRFFATTDPYAIRKL